MLLAERAGRKLERRSNPAPRRMTVIAAQAVVTESGLSACFTFISHLHPRHAGSIYPIRYFTFRTYYVAFRHILAYTP